MTATDIAKALGKVIQDLLVPEFRELRAEFSSFKEEVLRRFEQVDKRFEQVDKRFEQVDKRFEEIFAELREHRKILERHSIILESHNKILEQHSKAIEELLNTTKRLEIGQVEILTKLDLDHRITRVETLLEKAGIAPSGNLTVPSVREEQKEYGKK